MGIMILMIRMHGGFVPERFPRRGPHARKASGARVAGLLLAGALVAGCPADRPPPPAARSERVILKGSNTVGEELAPRLAAEFRQTRPGIAIEIETRGSASGFWGLIAGVCDIAASSRPMLADERQQAEVRGLKLNEYTLGAYAVAVVVNAHNPVTDLTREQVRDIFTGAVADWKEVGGPAGPIHIYLRDPVSGTYLGFRELALQDQPYATNRATALTNYAAIVAAVAHDPQGIGYAGFLSAGAPGVKAVSIGGVPPTAAAVHAGQYPYARMLRLYTARSRETPLARDFIQFTLSARGQEIVRQMDFVPRP